MPRGTRSGDSGRVIKGVIIHLENDLPIVADMDELPAAGDRLIRCTNVRTVDGKRPSFVHERDSAFFFPLGVIRLIEAPSAAPHVEEADQPAPEAAAELLPPAPDEPLDAEPMEDLLARIRDI